MWRHDLARAEPGSRPRRGVATRCWPIRTAGSPASAPSASADAISRGRRTRRRARWPPHRASAAASRPRRAVGCVGGRSGQRRRSSRPCQRRCPAGLLSDDPPEDAEFKGRPGPLAGGRVGLPRRWWDMAASIETIAEHSLAERLARTIQGRGAFRRFRAKLDALPTELTRVHRFADERRRGCVRCRPRRARTAPGPGMLTDRRAVASGGDRRAT